MSGKVKVWGNLVTVEWADPIEDPDPEVMAKVRHRTKSPQQCNLKCICTHNLFRLVHLFGFALHFCMGNKQNMLLFTQVKVLFVRNLASTVTEEILEKTFSQHGKLERVKKLKDYAFIHFEERESAVKV